MCVFVYMYRQRPDGFRLGSSLGAVEIRRGSVKNSQFEFAIARDNIGRGVSVGFLEPPSISCREAVTIIIYS